MTNQVFEHIHFKLSVGNVGGNVEGHKIHRYRG